MKVLSTISDVSITETDEPASADVILGAAMGKGCPGFDVVKALYSEDQMFLVIGVVENSHEDLPENIKWIPLQNAIAELLKFFGEFLPPKGRVRRCMERRPFEETADSLRILVVDDKNENLQGAFELLGNKHFLTLAGGYDEGLQMIHKNQYDVVLADCQMPPGRRKTPLSSGLFKVGDTVHNGLFLMFPATENGARFAIVTDANHHQDWVSAIFDGLRKSQVVNGQPVLFINYMGKKWDQALEQLLSI